MYSSNKEDILCVNHDNLCHITFYLSSSNISHNLCIFKTNKNNEIYCIEVILCAIFTVKSLFVTAIYFRRFQSIRLLSPL